jgi:hypothetical protein
LGAVPTPYMSATDDVTRLPATTFAFNRLRRHAEPVGRHQDGRALALAASSDEHALELLAVDLADLLLDHRCRGRRSSAPPR